MESSRAETSVGAEMPRTSNGKGTRLRHAYDSMEVSDPMEALGEDLFQLVLGAVEGSTLVELKAVCQAWRTVARRTLFPRLCHRKGQPNPAQPADVTDLDIEALNQTGREWEVAAAGRLLPNLARLHGFGFVVDVAAVRAADLDAGDEDEQDRFVALRACVTPSSEETPVAILLAAVACAASGDYGNVPVQALREDNAIGTLDLSGMELRQIEAWLLALLLPGATSLHTLK